MYNSINAPYELTIERLCRQYHKLPSEILNEDLEWIGILSTINSLDYEKEKKEIELDKLKKNGRQN